LRESLRSSSRRLTCPGEAIWASTKVSLPKARDAFFSAKSARPSTAVRTSTSVATAEATASAPSVERSG
jgi:hypothetical protein